MDANALSPIPARFNGPPGSANGGVACGRCAALVDGPAQVSLMAPPPLDAPFETRPTDGGHGVWAGDVQVAQARPADEPHLTLPARPSVEDARAASANHTHTGLAFPTCFVCGRARGQGDGLRIFPGPLEGLDAVAASWTPDASLTLSDADPDAPVPEEFVWAALDCPTYFAFRQTNLVALLARMTGVVERSPRVGEPTAVVAWPLAADGRKRRSASALLSANGEVLGKAEALWIELTPEQAAKVGAG